MTKAQQRERDDAKAKLLDPVDGYGIKPGDTIYTVLRHKSASGMSRSISLFMIRNGEPVDIDYRAAQLLGDKIDNNHGGIKIGGAGMDMGFALVYNLSRSLFPNTYYCDICGEGPWAYCHGTNNRQVGGFMCIGQGCPSNDHNNGDRDYTPHQHSDGGYALRHRWM